VLNAYELLARRIVVDFQLAPLVFDVLRIQMAHSDARLFVELLDLTYDVRCPMKTPPNG